MPIPVAAMALAGEAVGGTAAAGAAAGGGGMSALMGSLGGAQQGIGKLTGSLNQLGASAKGLIGKLNPIHLAREAFEKLTSTFDKLAPVVLETVGLFHPLTLLQFNRALIDLKATFGVIFKPVLQEVTNLIRRFADYMYSLPASFKSVIASLARTTAILGTVAALGTLFVTLGSAMLIVKAIFGPFVYLFETFKRTLGGASALQSALSFVEGFFQGIIDAVQSAWASISSVRELLSADFDALGSSLRELFDALRPLAALQLDYWAKLLSVQMAIWGGMIRVVTQLLTYSVRQLERLVAPLTNILRALGFEMPDVSRKEKSAMGLGWSGASVTDPASLYNKLTEEIARASRPGEEATADPQIRSADSLQNIETMLKTFLENGFQAILASTIGTVPPPILQIIIAAIKAAMPGFN